MTGIILCIPPTLDGWVYKDPIHGPLDGPLYTWAQYTPTRTKKREEKKTLKSASDHQGLLQMYHHLPKPVAMWGQSHQWLAVQHST